MSKSIVAIVATFAILLVGGIFYFSHAKAEENQSTPMQSAVEEGIISSEQAQQLQTHMQQQKQQKMQEKMQERLDKAVEDGQISQEESDEINNWFDSRPEALNKLKGFKKMGLNDHPKGSMNNCTETQ